MKARAPRPSYVAMTPVTPRPATVLEFLCIRFRSIGRERWEDRMRRGLVRSEDGAAIDPATPFHEGGRVSYFREVFDEPDPPEEAVVLHQEDAFVIADKPHGMPVVPGGEYLGRSLVYRLAESLGEPELAPAHRLDLDTAGLVLLVRRARDRALFHRLFAERSIQKGYRAISRGRPPDERYWRVRSRIVAAPPRSGRRSVIEPFEPSAPGAQLGSRARSVADPGGNAVSDIFVDRIGMGLVQFLVRPETGRQHQVRLHLTEIGYPIEGDTRYPERRPPRPGEPPLQLLAAEFSFRDPTTGRRHHFESSRRLALEGPPE